MLQTSDPINFRALFIVSAWRESKVKALESKLLVMYSWVWTTIIVSKNHVYMLNAFNCSRTPTMLKHMSVLPLVYISRPRAI